MKAILNGIALFCFAIMPASGAEPKRMTLHDAPRPLPDISFTDETGGSLTLKSYRGKVVLLNTWTTWCARCRGEVIALSIDHAGIGVVHKFYYDIGVKHHKIVIDQSGHRRWTCLGSRRQSLSAPMAWKWRVTLALPNGTCRQYALPARTSSTPK